MIVLLSYSTSWCQNNDTIPSTGVETEINNSTDSCVLIPISALKVANAKMIELNYEKEINNSLRSIIVNDSIIIDNLQNIVINSEIAHKKEVKKLKRQRNIIGGSSVVAIILLIILL